MKSSISLVSTCFAEVYEDALERRIRWVGQIPASRKRSNRLLPQ